MPRSLLIFNPAAGQWWKRPRPERLRKALAAAGHQAELLTTRGQDHATELVRAHLTADTEVVWVSGGDGTVAQAAAARVGSDVPIGILPSGTVNVVAEECGIPDNPYRAISALARTPRREAFQTWSVGGRAVLLGVGVGLEARAIGHTGARLKDWLGFLAIGSQGVMEWARYEFPGLRVTGEDEHGASFALQGTSFLATNPKRYAGHQIVAPSADPTDQCLDIVLIDGTSRSQLARFWVEAQLPGIRHLRVPGVSVARARRLHVEATDGKAVLAHLNGDAVEQTPVAVEPWGPVQLLVP
ncbi:diacylglycerol kinase family lipid kinase [soil metagenome]